MRSLTEIAPGVFVATSSYALTTTTLVAGSPGSGGCLLIDPAVTVAALPALAVSPRGPGAAGRGGMVASPALGPCAVERRVRRRPQVRLARRGDRGRDRPGRYPRRGPGRCARSRPVAGRTAATAARGRDRVGRAAGPADRA